MSTESLLITQEEADQWMAPENGPLLESLNLEIDAPATDLTDLVAQVRTGDLQSLPTSKDAMSQKIRSYALGVVFLEHFESRRQQDNAHSCLAGLSAEDVDEFDKTLPELDLDTATGKIRDKQIEVSTKVLIVTLQDLLQRHRKGKVHEIIDDVFNALKPLHAPHLSDASRKRGMKYEFFTYKFFAALSNAYEQSWTSVSHVPKVQKRNQDESICPNGYRHVARRNIRWIRDLSRSYMSLFSDFGGIRRSADFHSIFSGKDGQFLTMSECNVNRAMISWDSEFIQNAKNIGVCFCPAEYALTPEDGPLPRSNLTVALYNDVLAASDRWIFENADSMYEKVDRSIKFA